ncbi:MAG: hydantoinase/oxoprolinase N-terminal domain-containing protein, partial [Sulfitobacter sp.]
MLKTNRLRLAVDIGGTFTDTVLIDGQGAILATTKTPTTPANPTLGALAGAERVLAEAGGDWP